MMHFFASAMKDHTGLFKSIFPSFEYRYNEKPVSRASDIVNICLLRLLGPIIPILFDKILKTQAR